jgi:hypothetical protein
MTTDKTLAKADIMLETLLEYDEKDPDCTVKEVLEKIISKWSNDI